MFTAVIPARAGSKGAPGKNTGELAGKPLWRWSVDQARGAGAAKIVVSTDIQEIIHSVHEDGLMVAERSSELAGDDVPMGPVLMDLLADKAFAGDTIVLLQPTSPLRRIEDISNALDVFAQPDVELAMTVTEADAGVLKFGTIDGDHFKPLRDAKHCFSNRQSLPQVFRPNGAVYVFGRDWFLHNGGFETDNIGAVVMPTDVSQDIDTEEDFAKAEADLSGRV